MPQYSKPSGGEDESKKPAPPPLPPVPTPHPPPIQHSPFGVRVETNPFAIERNPPRNTLDKLDDVERTSHSTLPTDASVSLAQSTMGQDGEERGALNRAARLIAGDLDFPVTTFLKKDDRANELFGSRKHIMYFKDPYTGGTLSLASARRLIKPAKTAFIKRILQDSAKGSDHGRRKFGNYDKMNPSDIAEAVNSLSPLQGDNMAFDQSLGIAFALVKSGVKLSLFKKNLELATSKVPSWNIMQAVQYSHAAALGNMEWHSRVDALEFRYPEARASFEEAMRIKKIEEASGGSGPKTGIAASVGKPRVIGGDPAIPLKGEDQHTVLYNDSPESVKLAYAVLSDERGSKRSYDAITKDIIQHATAEKEAWENSLVGKTFTLWGKATDWFTRRPKAEITWAAAAVQGDLKQANKEFWEIWNGKRGLEEVLVQDWGVAPWQAATANFAVDWFADPTIFLAKAKALKNAARFIETYNREDRMAGWAKEALSWVEDKHLTLGNKKVSEYLLDSAKKILDEGGTGGSQLRYFQRITENFRTYRKTEGLDSRLTNYIYNWVHGAGSQLSREAQVKNIDEMLLVALGAKPAEETAAWKMVKFLSTPTPLTHMDAEVLQGAAGKRFLSEDDPLIDMAKREVEARQAKIDQTITDLSKIKDIAYTQQEIPFISLRRRIMGAITVGGDTRIGRAIGALGTTAPGQVADLEARYHDFVTQYVKRAREFSPEEIATYRKRAMEIAQGYTPNREEDFLKLTREIEAESAKRMAKRLGYDAKTRNLVLSDLEKEISDTNARLFGVKAVAMPDGTILTKSVREGGGVILEKEWKPLFESQLANRWLVADPIKIRQTLQDSIGATRAVQSAIKRVITGTPTKITEARLAHLLGTRYSLLGVMRDIKNELVHDLFLRVWKPLVVAVPRYVFRVPLMDEQLRFITDVGVHGRWEASKLMGLRNKVAHEAYQDFELSAERTVQVDDAVAQAGFSNREDAIDAIKAADRGHQDPWRDAQLEALGERNIRILRDSQNSPTKLTLRLHMPRPSELEDEALANSGLKNASSMFETWQSQSISLKRITQGRWDELHPETADEGLHLHTWSHVLNQQAARGSAGRQVLKGIVDGKTHDQMVDELEQFAHTLEGKRLRARLGISDDGIYDWAEKTVGQVRYYTGWTHDPVAAQRIAFDALNHSLRPQLLSTIPREGRPIVHGMNVIEERGNPITNIFNGYYRMILELPTNKLTRQPYFKLWYTRMRSSLLDAAKQSGATFDEDLVRKIEFESRKFALERVKKIMFDFRDQTRFSEMMAFLTPFMQPYQEAFMVWGHLFQQNPHAIPRMMLTLKWAEDSNFVRRDKTTGELVVPMSGYLWAAPIMDMMLMHDGFKGSNGWGLMAPLNNLNFFFNSTIQVDTGWFAGTIPIPVPSLSPPALYVMQQLSKHGFLPENVSQSLFEYGDVDGMSFLPSYMQHALEGLGIANQGLLKSQADDFLRLMEARGITPQTWAAQHHITVSKAETELRQKSLTLARKMGGVRAIMSFFFPTAPSVRFPTKELEDEFRTDVSALGYEKGKDAFLKKHPENVLITIGSTYWGRSPEREAQIGESSKDPSLLSIPANKIAAAILEQPGFKEFARQNPKWAFALIPSELYDENFDRATFFEQMNDGLRTTKDPYAFLADRNTTLGWNEFTAAKDAYDTRRERMVREYGEESATVARLDAQFRQFRTHLAEMFPEWGKDYSSYQDKGVDPEIMRSANAALKSGLFRQTSVGQALSNYMALLDETKQTMSDEAIHSLNTKGAELTGVKQDYLAGVAEIEKEHPEFKRVFDLFFSTALYTGQDVQTEYDKRIAALDDTQAEHVRVWEKGWNRQLEAPGKAINSSEAAAAFASQRKYAEAAYTDFGKNNPLKLWWMKQSPAEKQDYVNKTLVKPYVFWSEFDRETVFGEKSSPKSESYWTKVSEMNAYISGWDTAHPGASPKTLYEERDKMVRAWMKQDPQFAKQVHQGNSWGWALWNSEYTKGKGSAARSWRALAATIKDVQKNADKHGITGEHDFNSSNAALYGQMKNTVTDYIRQLFDYSPTFKRQYRELDQAVRGQLVDSLIPEWYFPLGGKH